MAEKKNTPPETPAPAENEAAETAETAAEATVEAASDAAADAAAAAASLMDEARRRVAAEAEEIAASFAEAQEEMRRALGELRTELSQIQLEEARTRVVRWIDENPALALLLAVGGGLLVGRLLYNAFKPAPPPPLPERVQERLSRQAHELAEEIRAVLRERTGEAGKLLRDRAERVGEEAARRAHLLGEQLGEAAEEVTGTVRHRAERGLRLAEGAWQAARTALAAFAVQRVADWARRLR